MRNTEYFVKLQLETMSRNVEIMIEKRKCRIIKNCKECVGKLFSFRSIQTLRDNHMIKMHYQAMTKYEF